MLAVVAGAVVNASFLAEANAVAPQKTIFAPSNAAFAAIAGSFGPLDQATVRKFLLIYNLFFRQFFEYF
jgi:hypothetical protein